MVNPLIDPLTTQEESTARTLEHLVATMAVSGLTAQALGLDAVTAADAAQNETVNNYLSPKQIRSKYEELAQGKTLEDKLAIYRKYFAISQEKNTAAAGTETSVMTEAHLVAIKDELASLLDGPTSCSASTACRTDVQNSIGQIEGILRSAHAAENLEPYILAANAVLILASGGYSVFRGAAGIAVRQAELDILAANGVKFTRKNVIATGTTPGGQIVFLETGSSSAGLQHIVERHGVDFVNKGIAQSDIPNVVMKAVTRGTLVGTNGSAPVYQITYGGVQKYISVGVSSNGFIVRANPVSTWRPL